MPCVDDVNVRDCMCSCGMAVPSLCIAVPEWEYFANRQFFFMCVMSP